MTEGKMTLAAARVNAGYTKKEAARILGVTPNAIYQWERNMTTPRIDTAKRMADLYGITLNDIFFAKRLKIKS